MEKALLLFLSSPSKSIPWKVVPPSAQTPYRYPWSHSTELLAYLLWSKMNSGLSIRQSLIYGRLVCQVAALHSGLVLRKMRALLYLVKVTKSYDSLSLMCNQCSMKIGHLTGENTLTVTASMTQTTVY